MDDEIFSETDLIIVPLIAEVIATEMPDKVRQLRFEALATLKQHIAYYRSLGFTEKLLNGIAEKKGKLIMEISSKTEMEKLMKPHCPHYDGNKFVPDKYNIPEEEIIGWSQASLKAPLNTTGTKRYMELFKMLFPDEYNTTFGKDKT